MTAEKVEYTYKQFGDALRRARVQRDLSYHSVADRIGVSITEVRDIEAGQRCPGAQTATRIFATFPMLGVYRDALRRERDSLVSDAKQQDKRTTILRRVAPGQAPRLAEPSESAEPPGEELPAKLPEEVKVDVTWTWEGFGAALRQARTAEKLTLKQLGELVGIDPGSIGKCETQGWSIANAPYEKLVTLFPALARYLRPADRRFTRAARLPRVKTNTPEIPPSKVVVVRQIPAPSGQPPVAPTTTPPSDRQALRSWSLQFAALMAEGDETRENVVELLRAADTMGFSIGDLIEMLAGER